MWRATLRELIGAGARARRGDDLRLQCRAAARRRRSGAARDAPSSSSGAPWTASIAGRARMRLSRRAAGVSSRRMPFALPRDKVVLLATGSQGETARGHGAHRRRRASRRQARARRPRDLFVAHHSRQRARGRHASSTISCDLGVEVITDHDHLVHCSGHPRRGEVAQLYDWVRPRSPCRRMARRIISPNMPPSRGRAASSTCFVRAQWRHRALASGRPQHRR